jgi:hypothetical protein
MQIVSARKLVAVVTGNYVILEIYSPGYNNMSVHIGGNVMMAIK